MLLLLLLFVTHLPNMVESEVNGEMASKPHIIILLIDDLGYNDVPWHNKELYMPNIMELAKSGTILKKSYTYPVCTPTRGALMTGRYAHKIGLQQGAISGLQSVGMLENVTTLPEVLKTVGYSTHIVGKWHLGYCKWAYTPTERGFDTFYGFHGSSGHYYTRYTKNRFNVNNETYLIRGYDYWRQKAPVNNSNTAYSTFAFAKEAVNIISNHNSNRPMFLYLPFQAVHGPLDAPETYSDLYSTVRKRKRRTFLGMLSALDHAIGDILAALKQKNMFDNSVILFSTDNGGDFDVGASNWPLRGEKHSLYEGGTRGAAFVHTPLTKKSSYGSMIHVVDWVPTLAEAAGAQTPLDIDGVSHWGNLINPKNSPGPRKGFIYSMKTEPCLKTAIRKHDFKLLVKQSQYSKPERSEEMLRQTSFVHQIMTFTNSLRKKDTSLYPDDLITSNPEQFEHEIPSMNEYQQLIPKRLRNDRNNANNSSLCGTNNFTDVYSRLILMPDNEIINMIIEKGDIQLYNVTGDPEENINLASAEPTIVKDLTADLVREFRKMMPPPDIKYTLDGSPQKSNGIWLPGWCE